ncbi:hypothetical protein [Limnoraphis robusta]|uniref:Uncharacterized protein n=1 Tax=Limnoraphis robusta CCNP1315 TaxID=3110306 RepID=A0ABU5U0U8_9CYAN|nr:hypothetical protein [Limnoraphis robusta]MEA5520808.1 hypothetical protein [Limnoraphis robusta CCNP1315]
MSKRTTKILIIGLLTTTGLTFGYFKVDKFLKVDSCLDRGGRWNYETNECELETTAKSDTVDTLHGYNELLGKDDRTVYTVSEYNTDLENVDNVKRPEKTIINNPTVDTALLFRIWTLDPDGPHADFWIKKEHFYIVDYDGDGRMPYILDKDSLTIYYNDFIQKGRVLKVTKDSMTIKWDDADEPTDYIEWRN